MESAHSTTPQPDVPEPPSAPQSPPGLAASENGAPAAAPTGPVRNLVVTQLPRSLDTATLYSVFGGFGEIVLALVMMDVHTGKSRGFGFVWFEEAAAAAAAMAEMNGKELEADAKPLKVFASQHPNGLSEDPCIEVVNFPSSIARSCGRDLFNTFGTVLRYEVAPFDGRASGSGSCTNPITSITVEFRDVTEARAAIRALHGQRALAVGDVSVNLQLPLVTKYLIGGKKAHPSSANSSQSRPYSLGGSATSASYQRQRNNQYNPNNSGSTNGLAWAPVAVPASGVFAIPPHPSTGGQASAAHAAPPPPPQYVLVPSGVPGQAAPQQPQMVQMTASGSGGAGQQQFFAVQGQAQPMLVPVQQQQVFVVQSQAGGSPPGQTTPAWMPAQFQSGQATPAGQFFTAMPQQVQPQGMWMQAVPSPHASTSSNPAGP